MSDPEKPEDADAVAGEIRDLQAALVKTHERLDRLTPAPADEPTGDGEDGNEGDGDDNDDRLTPVVDIEPPPSKSHIKMDDPEGVGLTIPAPAGPKPWQPPAPAPPPKKPPAKP